MRGVLQRNYNLLRQAARSCEVHVVAFDQPATRPPGVSVQHAVDALREFCASVAPVPLAHSAHGLHSYWLAVRGLVSREPYDIHWLASRHMAAQLCSTFGRMTFDVIHFDTLGLAQYRPLAGNVGTVLNHHNVESSMMERRAADERRILRRQYWRQQFRRLRHAEQRWCSQFAVNLVVSPEDGELLQRLSPRVETRLVPNGVDTDYFTPRPDPGGQTLLFCGGLDWYPNCDAMVYFFDAIWPRLTSRIPDVTLYVVGRKPPRWLRRLSEADSRVHVTGFVPDVRPYFRKATAYVCPIRGGGGTRLKILDALATGMPLIATPFACSGLSVEDGTHALLADTPEDFVRHAERVLADPSLRANLGLRGRELVCRDYSWPVVGRQLVQAYTEASLAVRRSSRVKLPILA